MGRAQAIPEKQVPRFKQDLRQVLRQVLGRFGGRFQGKFWGSGGLLA